MSTKINKKEVKKGKKVETKKEAKEQKKVMKREVSKERIGLGEFRKLTNTILTKNKGLALIENKHGAIQVKDDRGLLFSARGNNKVLFTHPMFSGTGKGKERVHKHPGQSWDNLSEVPIEEVTLNMLQARIDDKKSREDYHKEFYGKNPEKSGLFIKAEAARKRAKGITDSMTKRTKKADETLKAAKMAKIKVSKKGQKAITKIRKPAVAVTV